MSKKIKSSFKLITALTVLLLTLFSFQNCGEFSSDQSNLDDQTSLNPFILDVGDMQVRRELIDEEDLEQIFNIDSGSLNEGTDEGISSFGAKIRGVLKWPNGVIPISFDEQISAKHREIFMELCEELGEKAYVKCKRRRRQYDYVYVKYGNYTNGIGGKSFLGRRGGRQFLELGRESFGDGDFPEGTIVLHELMHAFGVAHEHQRYNRDKFINVLWGNIPFNKRGAYARLKNGLVNTSFDFDSIMIYDSFRTTSRQPGIVRKAPLNGSNLINLNYFMSKKDHGILKKMYGPGAVDDPIPQCETVKINCYNKTHAMKTDSCGGSIVIYVPDLCRTDYNK